MKNTRRYNWYFLLLFFCPIISSAEDQTITQKDSVIVSASGKYDATSPITYLLLGKNYRKIWSTPVKMRVFNIKNHSHDFHITKLGGGMQTKSLRMEDSRGNEWVLRTVDKQVEGALPQFLRNTIAEQIVQDMISAAHPYAPLVVSRLAKEIGVVAPDPELFYVPDDPNLDSFQKVFANQVCYLERREPTPDYSNAVSTKTVFEDLAMENTAVMQEDVLKARLLDMLIGDWDRHNGQWRWGKKDSNKITYFYPIPVDRDQAFFNSDGLLVKLVSSASLPFLKGFRASSYDAKDLNYKSWTFDRVLLNQLTAADWHRIILNFQQELTDQVIHDAVLKMPEEIYAIDGKRTEQILKSRRDEILKKAMRYYSFMARDVFYICNDNNEVYDIAPVDDKLKLTVYNYRKSKAVRVYERLFLQGEMQNLYLVGKSDSDTIKIEHSVADEVDIFTLSGDTDDLLYAKDK